MSRTTAWCLDLTRLVRRAAIPHATGIDRVERAYLSAFLQRSDVDVFAIAAVPRGFALLDRSGMEEFAQISDQNGPWDPVTPLSSLMSRRPASIRAAEATVARLALDQCGSKDLMQLVERRLPAQTAYWNVGHSNLTRGVLNSMSRLRLVVFVHDTIPLDFPQFQKPETPERFWRRLQAVSRFADAVLVPSCAVARDARRWFESFGRVPDIHVAPLGIDMPAVPEVHRTNSPYFVCVGTIEPRKNHALLLRLWSEWSRNPPDFGIPILHIIGRRGWQNGQVFSDLDRLPFVGRTVFEHTDADDRAVTELISGAHGLLHPSFAEGFGIPPHEALAQGVRPVLAPLPVYRETIAGAAIYADPSDLYQWQKAIAELVSENGQRIARDAVKSYRPPSWADHFRTALALLT